MSRHIFIIFLSFCCQILLSGSLAAQNHSGKNLAESARNYFLRGEINEAGIAARLLLQDDPQNPTANLINGLLLLNEPTVQNRIKASEIIDRYGSRLSDDSFGNYAQGLLFKAQRRPSTARKYFLKAIKQDPKFVDAYVELGDNYLHDMLGYYNRISDTSVPLSYRDYALEDYDLGVSYLHSALKYDPGNQRAAYILGSLHYELEDYNSMISLFDDMLEKYPDDKDLNLFMGLAYLGEHNYEEANRYFQNALKQMSGEEKKLFMNPEYLIKDKKDIVESDSEIVGYWKEKDPMFLTKENERLLEHYGRVAYANLRFGIPRLNIEGWQTDRGKTYIRYGKPTYIFEYGKTIEPNAIYSPMQVWNYPKFQLAFTDEFWNGEYRFTEPTLSTTSRFKERTNVNFTLVAENVFQTYPQTFDFELPGGKFSAPYRITYFKGEKGSEGLLTYAVPAEEELYEPQQQFQAGFFFLNDSNLPAYNFQQTLQLDFGKPAENRIDSFAVNTLTLRFQPGHYKYSFELLNKTLDKDFVDRQTLDVPDFDKDSLLVSDLLLARRVYPARKPGNLVRNGLFILPNIEQNYSREDTLFIYFEIYNLLPDADGSVNYTVVNSVTPRSGGGILGSIFGKDKQKVSIVNDYTGKKSTDFVVQSMDIKNLTPGEYVLEIDVKDDIGGTQTHRKTGFTILNSLTDY